MSHNTVYAQDASKCQFWKIDVDKCGAVSRLNGITGMPTFKIFQNAIEVSSSSNSSSSSSKFCSCNYLAGNLVYILLVVNNYNLFILNYYYSYSSFLSHPFYYVGGSVGRMGCQRSRSQDKKVR